MFKIFLSGVFFDVTTDPTQYGLFNKTVFAKKDLTETTSKFFKKKKQTKPYRYRVKI